MFICLVQRVSHAYLRISKVKGSSPFSPSHSIGCAALQENEDLLLAEQQQEQMWQREQQQEFEQQQKLLERVGASAAADVAVGMAAAAERGSSTGKHKRDKQVGL